MSLEAENLVTEEELKRISREFCLESIFILDLSCRGICALGPVCKCLNVCVLDLSSNNLSSVGDLVVLTALEHLDLSNNCISQLDGLQKLENLSRLELAGNKISRYNYDNSDNLLDEINMLALKLSFHCPLSVSWNISPSSSAILPKVLLSSATQSVLTQLTLQPWQRHSLHSHGLMESWLKMGCQGRGFMISTGA